MIVAQRIIRHKGSKVAERTGSLFFFSNVESAVAKAKRFRWVFSTLDNEGNEATIRSGRKMRKVDSVVLNVVQSGLKR